MKKEIHCHRFYLNSNFSNNWICIGKEIFEKGCVSVRKFNETNEKKFDWELNATSI